LGAPRLSVYFKRWSWQEWKFNTASVSTWLRDDVEEATGGIPDDLEELKLREQKAKTELTELELGKKKARLH
jgi:phage terminase Nu1 subunit (DNA packaging protein)